MGVMGRSVVDFLVRMYGSEQCVGREDPKLCPSCRSALRTLTLRADKLQAV